MFEFEDKELGKVIVKPNKRARHVIARRKIGYIQLTVPYRFSKKQILSVLQDLKPKLLNIKPNPPKIITEETVIETFSFRVSFVRSSSINSVQLSLKNGNLLFFIPTETDMSSPEFQERLKASITNVLRLEAKRILPQKTAFFAAKHGLKYQNVKINSSKTRWGSCSQKKNINFSLYLLLLPEKYIDYVVLHELTHTAHMNHSADFWQLLNSLCECDARALSKALKKHKSDSYNLLVSN